MVESTSAAALDILNGDPNELILGMPRKRYFSYTKKKAIIVVVSDYSALREIEGKEKYNDLPETLNDLNEIVKGIKHLGFTSDDIMILQEPSWNELHLKVIELAGNLHKSGMEGEKTLVFSYYAGHGKADNNLQVQLNELKLYPMEKMLRSLAKCDGSYVLSLFDCCRERITASGTRGTGEDDDNGIAEAQLNDP